MLKALELVGFKSFADKTRFEFPSGITVVVGPNGSGKSNIVDAIKWVLGEQSVKSLRGKEMADVIFNGSASRKALNAAECTLTFDNSTKLLAVDTSEVHITRRVYRSGEGEYLINRQPCRLRDIRELFAGTGVATEAYSVIEQGKVDVMLQASPRDRRMIFEEAAGISRFKTKKIEAQRRLERVEQNLLRLQDIVDEVESRLRSVRNQAGKAQRYKEYSDRLQALRTQVGLADWRKLSERLAEFESEVVNVRDEAASASAAAESLEAKAMELDLFVAECDAAIHSTESQIAEHREKIASHESTMEHERKRVQELEKEIARHRQHLTTMSLRAGDLEQQSLEVERALQEAETRHRQHAHNLVEQERGLTRLTVELDELRSVMEQRRSTQLEKMRAAANLGKQITEIEGRRASVQLVQERGEPQLAELDRLRNELATELAQQTERLAELTIEVSGCEHDRQVAEAQVVERRRSIVLAAQELAQLREKLSASTERANVLEELEKRLEGVTAGAKELLMRARDAETGPFTRVRGLVADLFNVEIETARIIEVALGELAQHVVVTGDRELIEHLQQEEMRLTGRVGLVRLDVMPPAAAADSLDLNGLPGVLGRADRFVETAPEHAALAKRLLGHTWIVEKLSHALALQDGVGRGAHFVTLAGELLSMDGTLQMGPRQTGIGLISRRSELRALRQQIIELTEQAGRADLTKQTLESQVVLDEERVHALGEHFRELTRVLTEQRLQTGAISERSASAERQYRQLAEEVQNARQEVDQTTQTLASTQAALAEIESELRQLELWLVEDSERLSNLDRERQRAARETSVAKIELARVEQQRADLGDQRQQLQRDQQERGKALNDSQQQLAGCIDRCARSQHSILRATSIVAELYLRREFEGRESRALVERRETARTQKQELSQEAQRARNRSRKLEARLHVKELAANEARHERTALADRLRDDYGIELASLEQQPTGEEMQEREAVEQEIADLRAKVNSIGSVNLEALHELEELEARFELLSTQFQDLTSAMNSLEQIIHKINADSRRLFADTLEIVRGHFQQLFRKLFGGGQADIVMDEGVDILESGIEIVARPPGKEPRNISLLSGGEKTLTCVALLLSIFRSKPSPFCVLDEVDAALDEANIDRFVGVLKEFLTWTQFIVVTHSKKTMTAASTLYGVTMQESGISKRVSVRFEDVTETGEIINYHEVEESGDTQAA